MQSYLMFYKGILGEGTFSTVFKARRRLDGCLYAVKRLKTQIQSERGGEEALKEVCALAALQGCPHIVRYFGCWLEDLHLWIQTELCLPYTLDIFVSGMVNAMDERTRTTSFCPASQDAFGSQPDCPIITPRYDAIQPLQFRIDYDVGKPEDVQTDMGISVSCKIEDCNNEDEDVSTQPVEPSQSTEEDSSSDDAGVPEQIAWMVARVVAETLSYMHEYGIAHLDIRPSNIFLSHSQPSMAGYPFPSEDISSIMDGLMDGTLCLKVGDLGLCCLIQNPLSASEGEARYCAGELINGIDSAHSFGSTSVSAVSSSTSERLVPPPASTSLPLGTAPFHSKPQLDLAKADIFSLGASIYELCKGRPLAGDGELENDISEWHNIRAGIFDETVTSRFSAELIWMLRQVKFYDITINLN